MKPLTEAYCEDAEDTLPAFSSKALQHEVLVSTFLSRYVILLRVVTNSDTWMLHSELSVLVTELNKPHYFSRACMMVLFISLHRSVVLPVVLYAVSARGVSLLLFLKHITTFPLVVYVASVCLIICYLIETLNCS